MFILMFMLHVYVFVFGQRNCENWLLLFMVYFILLFMVYFILNLLFVIPLILGSHWTLLVRDMSTTSVAVCSLFRLGEVYVANYVL